MPSRSGMPPLVLEKVRKLFGDKVALEGLDLTVPEGTIFGLLGPNGAGKSTTIRTALNIYSPDAGAVRLFGKPHNGEAANRIGYLPEERGLYTKMKVADLLIFMAAIHGVPAPEASRRIDGWLKRVDLPGVRERKVQELSKGMQQKVQFVATVLHDPELIFLDEPFSGLDPINSTLLKDIMVELHREGRTIVFSTHIMEQAERLCDALCLVNGGRKVLDGTLDSIRKRYGKNAVRVSFEGDGAFLSRHPLVQRIDDYRGFVEVRLVDGGDPQALLAEMVPRLRIRRFEIAEPSLHDIFIERVGETREDRVPQEASS